MKTWPDLFLLSVLLRHNEWNKQDRPRKGQDNANCPLVSAVQLLPDKLGGYSDM